MMVSIARAMLVLQALLLLTLFSSASTLGDGAGEDGEATGPRSASPGDGSHEREVCLRRLDELRVGSGGLEQEATLDAGRFPPLPVSSTPNPDPQP